MPASYARCPVCHGALNDEPLDGLCARCLSQVLFDPVGAGEESNEPAILADGLEVRSLVAISGYTATAELARGGMGIVYRAYQHEPGREVALKMLLPHQLGSQEMRQRFQLEARTIATLDHPAILPVYQVGECDGIPYFTMKLAAGGTLSERLQGFRGQWDRIADLVIALADAVHFAHQRGILHRDLKPGNVLFDEAGQAYVSDFGLAKLLEEDVHVTATFDLIGTPRYLPPEIIVGGVAGATVSGDVYGLCTILYELLAQRPIFEGNNPRELMRQIVDDEPVRPSTVVKEVPSDLETICLRGLSKRTSHRFSSASELAADLRRWRAGEPIESRPIGELERLRLWALRHKVESTMGLVILVLLLALMVGGGMATLSLASSRNTIRQERDLTRDQLVKSLVAQARASRLSDRLELSLTNLQVLVTAAEGARDEALESIRDEVVANLTVHDFAPTERRLPRLESTELLTVDPGMRICVEVDSTQRVHFRYLDGSKRAWSWRRNIDNRVIAAELDPSGRYAMLSYQKASDVLLDLATQTEVGSSNGDWGGFTPDGTAYISLDPRDEVHLWDLATRTEIDHWPLPVRSPAALIFDVNATDSRFMLARTELIELRSLRKSEPSLVLKLPERCNFYDWRSDVVAAGGERGQVYLWNLQNGSLRELHAHQGDVDRVTLSPDGELLLTCASSGPAVLWKVSTLERIGVAPGWRPVQFNRSGDELAVFTASEVQILRRIRPAGRRMVEILASDESGIRSGDFSPDGGRVAVSRRDGVHVLRLESGKVEAFLPMFGAHSAFWTETNQGIVAVGRSDLRIFAPTGKGASQPWELRHRRELDEMVWLTQAALSADHRTVAVFGYPDRVGLFDVNPEPQFHWVPSPVRNRGGFVDYDPGNGRFWVANAASSQLERIEPPGKASGVIPIQGGVRARFSPSGDRLLESGKRSHRVTELASRKVLKEIPVESSDVPNLASAWSSDGQLIAVSARGDTLDVYRTSDWKRVAGLPTPTFVAVTWLGFSPDGTTLGVGYANDLLEFWSLSELSRRVAEFGQSLPLSHSDRPIQALPSWEPLRRVSRSMDELRVSLRSGLQSIPAPPFVADAIPPRSSACTAAQLDLSPHFNRSLDLDSTNWKLPADGRSNVREIDGILFDYRAACRISAEGLPEHLVPKDSITNQVLAELPDWSGTTATALRDIRVGMFVDRIHFLGACDVPGDRLAITVGFLDFHYADGKSIRVPMSLKSEIGDHWVDPSEDTVPTGSTVAHKSLSPISERAQRVQCLYRYTWTNPRPQVAVDHLDFRGSASLARTRVAPFLVGITVEPAAKR